LTLVECYFFKYYNAMIVIFFKAVPHCSAVNRLCKADE
jgi:hypothetical protein